MLRTLLVFILLSCTITVSRADDRHVVIITLDGFPAYLFNDPKAPIPIIRKLAARGVVAEGMRVVNPSVTWPNHTTLVTGVFPAKHGVLFNGVLVRGGPGVAVKVDPARDQSELIAVPTIWDIAHRAGLTTAGIDWPCSRNATGLDDNFPDVPEQVKYISPRLRDELLQTGILPSDDPIAWKKMSWPQFEEAWAGAACYVIKHRKPNLLVFHILLMDGFHHFYGPQSQPGYLAAASLDREVGDVLKAIDDAGIAEQTTIFLTADHGFALSPKLIEPNVMLRKAHLLHATAASINGVEVQAVPEGGTAFIYFTDPAATDALREKVRQLFEGHEGIAEVIAPDRFAALGFPLPDKNKHMADLVLAAKEGYAFGTAATGDDDIRDAVAGVSMIGNHGYLNTNPKMNALFIAAGRGIRKDVKLGVINNVSVAPTAAHLLGLEIPNADGKVLTNILSDP